MSTTDSVAKFDASRANEYEQQSRIALAGYDACHELAACMLAASLGSGGAARVLVVGDPPVPEQGLPSILSSLIKLLN